MRLRITARVQDEYVPGSEEALVQNSETSM